MIPTMESGEVRTHALLPTDTISYTTMGTFHAVPGQTGTDFGTRVLALRENFEGLVTVPCLAQFF